MARKKQLNTARHGGAAPVRPGVPAGGREPRDNLSPTNSNHLPPWVSAGENPSVRTEPPETEGLRLRRYNTAKQQATLVIALESEKKRTATAKAMREQLVEVV